MRCGSEAVTATSSCSFVSPERFGSITRFGHAPTPRKTRWPVYLSSSEIEKEFLLAAIHLKQIVVLDEIERVAEPPGFRIRSHDLHGPLPEIAVLDTGDHTEILETVSREAAKLNAIARHREELAVTYQACQFLPQKILDSGVVVGMQVERRTILAEAPTFWQAYGKLRQRVFRKLS